MFEVAIVDVEHLSVRQIAAGWIWVEASVADSSGYSHPMGCTAWIMDSRCSVGR